MRHTAAEKYEIIRLVEGADLPVRRTLRELQVNRSTFYAWYRRYTECGRAGLEPKSSAARRYWNRIPPRVRQRVVEAALADPERSPRELAWQLTDRDGHFVSESSVYRILKAYDLMPSPAFIVLSAAKTFQHPTHRPNELWQTDFTYLQVVGWGWYYLSTVLDDYSRYIVAWTVRTSMQASDVTETLDLARAKTGVDRVQVRHRPRLLSDNGPCYVSQELATYLNAHGLGHTRGAPYHPMTQGKIERYHRSMKNVVKLEKYYSPWELERAVARGLALRMDHGSQYLSDHFLKQIRYWGIHPSFGFVEEPETNGVVERWNRTLKEQAIHGRIFQNLEAVRVAVADFVVRYNQTWRLEKLAYQTPIEAREEYELRQAA